MKLYLPKEFKENKIELPEKLKQTLELEGIKQLPEQVKVRGILTNISYSNVVHEEEIIGISYPYLEVKTFNQLAFSNKFKELQKNKTIIKEIAKLLKLDPKFSFEKYIMVTGATLPIKLIMKGREKETIWYIKKSDPVRTIGNTLYNIATNTNEHKIYQNSRIIIESEIKGILALNTDERMQLTVPEYKRGLGKLAAVCDYLGLAADIAAPKNRIIGIDNETKLFDFDGIFVNPEYQQGSNPIITYFAKFKGKERIDKFFIEGFVDELKNIARNLEEKIDIINNISESSGKITMTNNKAINTTIKQLFGEESILKYTKQKIRQYKNI